MKLNSFIIIILFIHKSKFLISYYFSGVVPYTFIKLNQKWIRQKSAFKEFAWSCVLLYRSLVWYSPFVYFGIACAFGDFSKSLSVPISCRVLPMFSSASFMDSACRFRFFIQSELMFFTRWQVGIFFLIPASCYPIVPFVEDSNLLYWIIFSSLLKTSWLHIYIYMHMCIYICSLLGFLFVLLILSVSVLVQDSFDDHCPVVSLEVYNCDALALFLFFRIAAVIHGLLCSQMHCCIFSVSEKINFALNPYLTFGNINILMMWILLIQEHSTSLHLLMAFYI